MNEATCVDPSYEVEPATSAFAASRSVNETVPACTASLNVAPGATDVATPVAPATGEVAATVGGVVSGGGGDELKTTSTQ